MNYDEDAVKVIEQVGDCIDWDGGWDDREEAIRCISAFGRRCAEAMREECVEIAKERGNLAIAVALSRVEVK